MKALFTKGDGKGLIRRVSALRRELQTIDVPASRAVLTNVSFVAWRPRCGSGDGGVFESTNGRELVEPRREESNLGDPDSPSRGGRRHRRL
jgi:hypothetical protein